MSRRQYYESLLQNPNIRAMLNTIAIAEGCDDNYGCSYGGTTLPLNGRSHPFSGSDCSFSTTGPRAVGRYQFCGTTWDEVSNQLGGLDFSNPRDQDLAAVALMDRRQVLDKVVQGDVQGALTGVGYPNGLAYEWASLPPYRYEGQGTKSMEQVVDIFRQQNGKPLPISSVVGPSSPSGIPGGGGSSSMGGGGAKRGACPDYDYTMASAKIMTGCQMEGSIGLGYGNSVAPGGVQGVPGAAAPTSLTNVPIDPKLLGAGYLWPVRDSSGARIGELTSGFGYRSCTGCSSNHRGIDIGYGNGGVPIVASLPGKVVTAITGCVEGDTECGGRFGNWVCISHSNGSNTVYAHLQSVGVSQGQDVTQGQTIGTMGNTGSSTGPHLHFEIRMGGCPSGGNPIDPQPLVINSG